MEMKVENRKAIRKKEKIDKKIMKPFTTFNFFYIYIFCSLTYRPKGKIFIY